MSENVRAEFSLTALAYNLRRAITESPRRSVDCSDPGLEATGPLSHDTTGGVRRRGARLDRASATDPRGAAINPFACTSWIRRKVEFPHSL